MRVSATEAKGQLTGLVSPAEAGGKVILTRHEEIERLIDRLGFGADLDATAIDDAVDVRRIDGQLADGVRPAEAAELAPGPTSCCSIPRRSMSAGPAASPTCRPAPAA